MAKKKAPQKQKQPRFTKPSLTLSPKNKIILGSFLFLFGLALLIAFISFLFNWQADQSVLSQLGDRETQTQNLLSKFGAGISHFFIYDGFGIASFALAVLTVTSGIYFFFNLNKNALKNFWFWGILVMIWLSVFFGFFSGSNSLLGGTIGYEMNDYLQDYLGFTGTILLLTFLLVVYLVARLKVTPEKVLAVFRNTKQEISDDFKAPENRPAPAVQKTEASFKDPSEEKQEPSEVIIEEEEKEEPSKPQAAAEKVVIRSEEDPDDLEMEVETATEEEEVEDNLSTKLVQDYGEFDPTLELKNFQFPTLELLKDYNANGGGITINQEELEENKNRIVDTLKNYKIDIAQIKATVGPTVTLYEIIPEAGIRISKIKSLEDDIALSLAALGIRIIAPIPGKGTIGIEVPNKNSTMVSMRSVIASPKFQKAEMELPMALGKTISNETFVVDLAKMPHLLMAGATGQGKSVGLNAILTSLLYSKHPAEVKFILVDPKKVELTLFNKIERHYLAKLPDTEDAIITDNTKVINTLNSLCIEMDERYELLKEAMVRNIKEYNAKFKARKLNPENGHRFLPYIVLVVDEFADLIMTAGKEVEAPIARLAQLARAIGIHLIIATQRPSVNVITGIIKANFPARIAFRVTSKIDSRTILDSQGADQLIGKGDMLFTQGNTLLRLQCAFVDTPEVEKITEFIGSQKAYPDAYQLPEYSGEESGTGLDIEVGDRDKLFREAAEVIVIAQQGSASLLQRKLKLGYNRAGRIIDQLEAAGVVGPFEGSKARQVLVQDLEGLNQLLDE
ncbi:DNA segregation ATPase FtsK/SpoIIIE, S-DNA-T family [Salinimicrobium catena]|uniref:DNA segregation ATPase FtsK/SpoIIIE, S-DNA-T family n=1 Tax=Salinimicrobium catena TaxID=390640 RepID=A0A1H5L9V0_9FLAO|nr:DNA translocase FtsK [Salinimicrobium catena]SDL07482.1 DNA segregation ATPase FtsK/SpoIIIE, S-DNA-T family [Salinimicrobium catena]SEE73833.1 DNA segregation ATPase FtsK/SpoIIIE, S-DNA-T family [Salinimicrobium catena]